MKINKPITLFASLMMGAMALWGQNTSLSPYSRYGYGQLNDRASSTQRAMGGVGYAMNNGRQINAMNPASYANIDTLTFLFDMGFEAKQLWSTENGESGKKFGGGLDYITMQFPLAKNIAGSVGLIPFSQVGYSFGDEIINGENSHQGSGGINELYAGVSVRPFKGFSVGANVSYMFGTLLNDTYLYTTTSNTAMFERVMQVRDYNLNFGVQYSVNVAPKHRVGVGAVYSPAKDFRGNTYGVMYTINASEETSTPDTIGYSRLRGNYSMPATYGVGLNYQWNNRVMAEVDFTYQPWKNAKYKVLEGYDAVQFNNRWKAALGLQYTPDVRGSYLRRISYRMGAYLNRDYVMAEGNNVKDIGVTVGFGLPTPVNRWTKTVVNVGFEYRHRTSSPVKLVTENYFQVTLGVNFNELWFWKNKIQ